MMQNPLVGIIMGSKSDVAVMESAGRLLDQFEIPYEMKILSAHRTPDQTAEYVMELEERGVKVLIAGAGWAAHLAGVSAARTTLPVIGVPIDSSPLKGMDSLLSTVQMPPGVPVATMSIGKGGAYNAAVFAVRILSLLDPAVARRYRSFIEDMAKEVISNSDL
ncbi:MAG: 5-(carboxyamino)imidazole ribonucleotide mutase [Deltaproteobacteria bacterium]|nr:5-(carboxyamino)imidazole ribonucleotide mutase [Deltaproteobacteria bacterium]MDA8305864.1 5-(carboxyamino)imidazole ribonucleotide mutase [Deltaproteobacteria bacterium]